MNEHEMTKEEAVVRLGALAHGTADAETLRALLLGCKALARAGIHKRRNKAARAARAAAAKQESATETEARS